METTDRFFTIFFTFPLPRLYRKIFPQHIFLRTNHTITIATWIQTHLHHLTNTNVAHTIMSTTDKEDVEPANSTPKEHESKNQDDKGNNKNENPEEVEQRSLVSNNLTNDTEQTTPQTDPKTTTFKPRTSADVNPAPLSESEQQSKVNDLISNTTETSKGTGATTTSAADDQSKPLLPTTVRITEQTPTLDKQQEYNGKCHNHSDQYDFVCSNLIKPR